MKKPYLVSMMILLLNATFSFSQSNVIRVKSCEDALITHQVDSLKNLYAADGFILMKEASISMESEYEMPVVVPLNQGSLYNF